MNVGFIGLGIMGQRMAANLQKAGYPLTVYNRTASRAQDLVANGAHLAPDPAEASMQADILFTMLSTPAVVEKTAIGKDGFLASMKPGALWIDSSTVNPSFSRRMALVAREHGIRFLGAPVAGSKVPAEKGQLTFLVGGDERDLEEARPLLEKMVSKIIHAGGQGMGAALKMVFNLLLGVNMLAFAEALLLGESLGLSKDLLFTSLGGSIVVPPFAISKRAKLETGEYEVDFPLQWLQKDLQLASESAYEQGVALPATNIAKEIYALAKRHGLSAKDFSAIYQFLKEGSYPPADSGPKE
jgi:3-hydroxyisobutyrate dehydrogenase/glyoxylate/succinic semialdehyde reductase